MKGSYNDMKFRLKLFVCTKMLSFKIGLFLQTTDYRKLDFVRRLVT